MHHPALKYAFAGERARELARAASRARLAKTARSDRRGSQPTDIVIREAGPTDVDAVARLARLDGRPVPAGPVVVASVRGRLQAAVAANGEAVSDPFVPTADLVALLRMRVRQLQGN